MSKSYTLLVIIVLCLISCDEKPDPETQKQSETQVVLQTTAGDITLKLYDETPKHRDNFIKLVKDQAYDSLLFHRVIQNFMIQAGDPSSKNANKEATLGEGDLPYTVPAEFTADAFHKRGALGAARNGNIARASSAMQFYIVQGRVYTDSTLQRAEGRINIWLAQHAVVNDPANSEWASIWAAFAGEQQNMSQDSILLFRQRIDSLATIYQETATPYRIPDAQREVYKTKGGTAHLDQNYTVFGEVLSGMEVIDSIAASPTNDRDRPLQDVRILGTKIIQ